MNKKRINTLYSMLINIDDHMIFEDYFTDIMNTGKVLVNDKRIRAKDINMPMYLGDTIQYKNQKYMVGTEKLELI